MLIIMTHSLYCDSSSQESVRLNCLDICKNLKSILLENRNNPEIKSLVEVQLNQINSIVDSRKQEQEFEKLKEVKNKLNANKRYLDSVEQTNWD